MDKLNQYINDCVATEQDLEPDWVYSTLTVSRTCGLSYISVRSREGHVCVCVCVCGGGGVIINI